MDVAGDDTGQARAGPDLAADSSDAGDSSTSVTPANRATGRDSDDAGDSSTGDSPRNKRKSFHEFEDAETADRDESRPARRHKSEQYVPELCSDTNLGEISFEETGHVVFISPRVVGAAAYEVWVERFKSGMKEIISDYCDQDGPQVTWLEKRKTYAAYRNKRLDLMTRMFCHYCNMAVGWPNTNGYDVFTESCPESENRSVYDLGGLSWVPVSLHFCPDYKSSREPLGTYIWYQSSINRASYNRLEITNPPVPVTLSTLIAKFFELAVDIGVMTPGSEVQIFSETASPVSTLSSLDVYISGGVANARSAAEYYGMKIVPEYNRGQFAIRGDYVILWSSNSGITYNCLKVVPATRKLRAVRFFDVSVQYINSITAVIQKAYAMASKTRGSTDLFHERISRFIVASLCEHCPIVMSIVLTQLAPIDSIGTVDPHDPECVPSLTTDQLICAIKFLVCHIVPILGENGDTKVCCTDGLGGTGKTTLSNIIGILFPDMIHSLSSGFGTFSISSMVDPSLFGVNKYVAFVGADRGNDDMMKVHPFIRQAFLGTSYKLTLASEKKYKDATQATCNAIGAYATGNALGPIAQKYYDTCGNPTLARVVAATGSDDVHKRRRVVLPLAMMRPIDTKVGASPHYNHKPSEIETGHDPELAALAMWFPVLANLASIYPDMFDHYSTNLHRERDKMLAELNQLELERHVEKVVRKVDNPTLYSKNITVSAGSRSKTRIISVRITQTVPETRLTQVLVANGKSVPSSRLFTVMGLVEGVTSYACRCCGMAIEGIQSDKAKKVLDSAKKIGGDISLFRDFVDAKCRVSGVEHSWGVEKVGPGWMISGDG